MSAEFWCVFYEAGIFPLIQFRSGGMEKIFEWGLSSGWGQMVRCGCVSKGYPFLMFVRCNFRNFLLVGGGGGVR